ncbi:hypothetical protein D3C74_129550 [compost metagenome]
MNSLELFALEQEDTLDLDLQVNAFLSEPATMACTGSVTCAVSACYDTYVTCNCC